LKYIAQEDRFLYPVCIANVNYWPS